MIFTAHTMGSQWLDALPRLTKLGRSAQVGSSRSDLRRTPTVEHRRHVGAPRTVPGEVAPTEATSGVSRESRKSLFAAIFNEEIVQQADKARGYNS